MGPNLILLMLGCLWGGAILAGVFLPIELFVVVGILAALTSLFVVWRGVPRDGRTKKYAGGVDDPLGVMETVPSRGGGTSPSLEDEPELVTDLQQVEIQESLMGLVDQLEILIRERLTSGSVVGLPEEIILSNEDELQPRLKRLQTDTKAVLGNVSQAFSISDNLSKTAKDTFALAEKVQKGIENINQILRKSLENTSFLEEQSQKISKILDLMGEVSSQIHVLSINASIVSARAGVHGRGFEVVAKEIRELSHQTESSLQEISDSIQEIQQTIRLVGEDTYQADQATAEETKSLISVAGSLQGVQLAIEVVHTVSTNSKEKIQQQIDDLSQIDDLHLKLKDSLQRLVPVIGQKEAIDGDLFEMVEQIRQQVGRLK